MAAQYDYDPANVKIRNQEAVYKPAPKKMANVLDMLNAAKKPLIMTGGGVILGKASDELTLLARKYENPVTGTLMGLRSFPGTDPLWLGMLGMHGTYYANMAVSHCDFMLAVGVRFDDRVTGSIETFASNAKIVHIDIDPSSINKNVTVDLPIIGDTKATPEGYPAFSGRTSPYAQDAGSRAQWLREIAEWREKVPLSYCQNSEVIKPQYVIQKLQELTKGDALITTDVGQHQMWTAQFFNFDRPNTFVSSGGLGTIGWPARRHRRQMRFSERQVVAIAGDGSIQMNIQELATAAQYNIAVKVVLLNNEF